MFMLISLVNKKSDFEEEKHFFNKNNLRKGYGEFSKGGFSVGEFSEHQFKLLKSSSFLVLECCLQFSKKFLYGVLLRDLFVTK